MGCITKLLESGQKHVRAEPTSPYVDGGGLYKGYEYLIVLVPMGHRCGYIAISEEHILYKEEGYYGAIGELEMHGGCTFYDKQFTRFCCSDKWIGFDCAHCADIPDLEATKRVFPDLDRGIESRVKMYSDLCFASSSVKTKEFVEDQCKSIIDQLVAKYPLGKEYHGKGI